MASLLTIRDEIKNFCSKYDKFISPVIKFILAFVMFWSISHLTGYHATLSGGMILFLLSVVCAFMSEGITLALGGIYACGQLFSGNMEIAIVFVILFIIMYCVYIRFFPKTSWIIMFMPFMFVIKFQYFMPILAGMLVGASGIMSAAFGCIFFFFLKYAADYMELSAVTAEEDMIEGYKYMFQSLVEDKNLILTIIVFAVVIVLTNIIYKLSFDFSWYAAVIVGGLLEIILFLIGNFAFDASVSLIGALFGSVIAILVAVVVQFFKGVVDYSRVENTQFEDDEYYYYVKAVPKVVMGKQKKAVRTISSGGSSVLDEDTINGATR
ncbi:MAG: hypothetical protein ACI4EF_09630 [Coprococcus sp.]